jgi:hypothetical protein
MRVPRSGIDVKAVFAAAAYDTANDVEAPPQVLALRACEKQLAEQPLPHDADADRLAAIDRDQNAGGVLDHDDGGELGKSPLGGGAGQKQMPSIGEVAGLQRRKRLDRARIASARVRVTACPEPGHLS